MADTFGEVPEHWAEVSRVRGATTDQGRGALRTNLYNQGELREFLLTWEAATAGIKTALEILHASTFGGALTMEWTPPGETNVIRVKFLPGEAGYSRDRNSANSYSLTVGLIEASEFRSPSQIT